MSKNSIKSLLLKLTNLEILKEEREKLDASFNQNIKLADQLNAVINRINERPKNVHITVFVFIINYIFKFINSY